MELRVESLCFAFFFAFTSLVAVVFVQSLAAMELSLSIACAVALLNLDEQHLSKALSGRLVQEYVH